MIDIKTNKDIMLKAIEKGEYIVVTQENMYNFATVVDVLNKEGYFEKNRIELEYIKDDKRNVVYVKANKK
ncbi:hypothetical protein ACSXED_17595 (plasmid) [Clostridium perfringens]